MNRERIQKLIDLFETLPDEKVDMSAAWRDARGVRLNDPMPLSELQHTCGTAACITGWAQSLFPSESADDELGLEMPQTMQLYMPRGWHEIGSYTRTDALTTLKHLLETGEVRWPEKAA